MQLFIMPALFLMAQVQKLRCPGRSRCEAAGYRVSKELRQIVVFALQNVLSDPPFSHVDLISCRNLLIDPGIESEFQSPGMKVIRQRLHSRRKPLRVRQDVSMRIAINLPAVVNDEVNITRVFHAARYHCIGHLPDKLLVNVAPIFCCGN